MSLELLKVEFQIVGLRRDEDGTPVEEVPLAQGSAYAKGLDSLPDEVRSVVEQAAKEPIR